MTEQQPTKRIPEERVSAILKRAAELDRKVQETVELDAIRAAAVEAGISLSAVDLALEEYAAASAQIVEAEPVQAPPAPPSLLRRWWDKLTEPIKLPDALNYALFGLICGLIAAAGEAGAVVPILALPLASLRMILQDRPTGRVGRFLKNITVMTLAMLAAYMGAGEADEDLVAYVMMIGAALLPFGVLAIKTVGRKPQQLEAEQIS